MTMPAESHGPRRGRIPRDGDDLIAAGVLILHYRHSDIGIFIRGGELIGLIFVRRHEAPRVTEAETIAAAAGESPMASPPRR